MQSKIVNSNTRDNLLSAAMSKYEDNSPNPYAAPNFSLQVAGQHTRPLVMGLLYAIVYSLLTLAGCGVLTIAAKIIDTSIPFDVPPTEKSIAMIFWEKRLLFSVLIMLSGFSAFAYHAGRKQINSGLCLIAVFCGGIVGRTILSWFELIALRPSRDETSLYPSEIITYLGAYAIMSIAIVIIANRLACRIKSVVN